MADGDITFTNSGFDFVSVATDRQSNFVIGRDETQVAQGPDNQSIMYAWRIGKGGVTLAELQQYETPASAGDAIVFAPPLPPGQVP